VAKGTRGESEGSASGGVKRAGACGWANRECQQSFLAGARGQLDYVLLLTLVHHLLVNERAPLAEIFALAAELTTQFDVIE
jgi:hypothetical protein